jgi:hypothetical protein
LLVSEAHALSVEVGALAPASTPRSDVDGA